MECVNLMMMLVQCVITVSLFNIILFVASLDESNLIVFQHTSLSDCEVQCVKRPCCTGPVFIKHLKSNVYVTLNVIGSFLCNLCFHWLIQTFIT